MTIILTISTIIMTTLFFVACYLLNTAIEEGIKMEDKLKEIDDKYYESLETNGFHPDFINAMKSNTANHSGYLFRQD